MEDQKQIYNFNFAFIELQRILRFIDLCIPYILEGLILQLCKVLSASVLSLRRTVALMRNIDGRDRQTDRQMDGWMEGKGVPYFPNQKLCLQGCN